MNVLIFDTETANLEKPFCYNLGYVIADTESGQVVLARDFVIEQVWHNTMLFTTAYYANKRALYVSRMRARQAVLDKWGYVMRRLYQDIVDFEISDGYAYNNKFDEGVFEFNCDWFKTINPLENLKIHDIRGYVHHTIAFTDLYKNYCDMYQLYTDSGNYSTTAEAVYRFIKQDHTFEEEHTALADSQIEWEILNYCIGRGSEWNTDYTVYRSIARTIVQEFEVIDAEGESHKFPYTTKRKINNGNGVQLFNRERA